MPATHVVKVPSEVPLFTVEKNGTDVPVNILKSREEDVYVHYIGFDRRMNGWIPKADCKPLVPKKRPGRPSTKRATTEGLTDNRASTTALSSRGRSVAPPIANGKASVKEIEMTEEEYDLLQHKLPDKNFEKVCFGNWEVKTWYFSPYPLIDFEVDDLDASTPHSQPVRIGGVSRGAGRSHGRTLDILMGTADKARGNDRAALFVCEMCFKYMTDASAYEAHTKCCTVKHPPGRRVYHKGRDTIWEVDGASNKVYCQNLALFGKLFIDHKTLYFDCENFSYYVLTDTQTTTSDHIMGYFSKEKISYDDYNLACIVILPPYQRKSYGMLMIEFSYELSRHAGKVGTPERPLSDLGLRSYLAFWVGTLIRFFKRVLTVVPDHFPPVYTSVGPPNLSEPPEGSKKRKRIIGFDGEADPNAVTPPDTTTNGASSPPVHVSRSPNNAVSDDGSADPLFTTQRMVDTIKRVDGSAELHVSVRCTLAGIARATNLRVEDAAFALHECGLLARKLDDEEAGEFLVITGEAVERVAVQRRVKKPCIDLAYVLL